MKKQVIGLLTSTVTSAFHKNLLFGVHDTAQKLGYSLYHFAGAPVKSTSQYSELRTRIYETLNTDLIRGLIIPSSSLLRFLSDGEQLQFVDRFRGIPIVTVGSALLDYPYVKADYRTGMTNIVLHLIHEHRCRRIMFVRGPAGQLSSEERLEAYRKALTAENISFDPDLVVVNSLFCVQKKQLAESILSLIKIKKVDAIATTNDSIAMSIITVLKEAHIRVPEDILVTGFQGAIDSMFVKPLLTTVDENIYGQGLRATEVLIRSINKEDIEQEHIVTTRLVLRESCGCSHVKNNASHSTKDQSLLQHIKREHTTSYLLPLTQETTGDQLEDPGLNLSSLSKIKNILEKATESPAHDVNIPSLLKSIEEAITQSDQRNNLYYTYQMQNLASLFRIIGSNIVSNINFDAILDILAGSLQIEYSYLILPAHENNSRVLSAYAREPVVCENEFFFPREQMLPEALLPQKKPYSLSFFPLVFQKEYLGYAVFSFSNRGGNVYETLQSLLSISVKTFLQSQELAELEKRFLDLEHRSSDWLWEINSELILTYSSPNINRILGYSPSEMIGKNFLAFMKQGEETCQKTFTSLVLQKKPVTELESWYIHKNGSLVGLLVSALPIIKSNGDLIGYRGISRDITETKKAEEKIKFLINPASAANNIISTMSDALLLTDMELKIIQINGAAAELFGHSEKELFGKTLFFLMHTSTQDQLKQTHFKKNFDLKAFDCEMLIKTGSKIPVSLSSSTLKDADNNVIGAIIIVRDMKLRRAMELEKKNLEEQLFQAQKMEAIGQLAGGIAHDFNNMLGAILGYSDMIRLQFAEENPTLGKYTDVIIKTSKRAADLTSKLLAFARKGKFEIIKVDMHESINNVIRLLEHSIDKKIRIIKDLRAVNAYVLGDPTQLQNLILNLAVNARDAMPEGGELVFSSENVALNTNTDKVVPMATKNGTCLKLAVTDTGMGMDLETQKRIFEPFFTTKEQGKGTGLGLASVYGTVKSHNGSIEVFSEPHKGTSFVIYLQVTQQQQTGVKANLPGNIYPGTGKVLVIDDEEYICSIAEEMLVYLGYKVIWFTDAQQACEYYTDNYKDIGFVLLDIIMPALNGYDTFLALKKINPGVKAMISSGFALNSEAKQILDAGARGFIQKPYEINKLSTCIHEFILV